MESVVVARRVARGIITRFRKRVIDAMEPAERNAYDAKYGMKVPFTEEMMAAHRIKYFTSENASVEDKMAYVATALGYHIGNSIGNRNVCKVGPKVELHEFLLALHEFYVMLPKLHVIPPKFYVILLKCM